jgi:hypothetical protein
MGKATRRAFKRCDMPNIAPVITHATSKQDVFSPKPRLVSLATLMYECLTAVAPSCLTLPPKVENTPMMLTRVPGAT